ncbi:MULTISPECIES: ABC transporter ATP-binding protein [Methylibium]|uniref:Putative ATP-binding component of ABC transporter n=1 Tax=Methylibium petroleiphilum (strain ATCC BAA-1232 / LMG 22953 / PM1) TaxID=420662 RepID=A2SGU6_METPP|nr:MULTISPECIES: ABC transporter ATP-binding protein [Methylibium]ABM94785.1 putative ATP-binding component of ABC transporter [Methylibium petroleiphilum PM1]EWS55459.1 putative ABC transporter ATP-binding protein [Methylibium sp. T29]EWS61242.1 putative ABC transporter ATP-binding protein [Methylibium sp. T29-B]
MTAATIELEALRYAWPGSAEDTLAIDALAIDAGASVFLHGPSGSGKSTLLGLLAGVLLPRVGEVRLLGQSWSALSGARRDAFRADHVGYVFQQFNLLPYLSTLDNVLLACRFSAQRAHRAAQLAGSTSAGAEQLLGQVGLPRALWSRPAAQLSVGQQQRVAAARALIGSPEIVIADEPTSALDADLRDGFMDLLLGECRRAGSTLVFVSHDERLAARFDRRVSTAQLHGVRKEAGA